MIISKQDQKASKFISLILRHKPQEIGLQLDEYGYINTNDLIDGMNVKGYNVTILDIERIVAEDDKQRYSFNSDKSKIKANQGHSIEVNLELQPVKPPDILYHGTAKRVLDNILSQGITKQARQYVHLSADIETASKVGKRHGELVIFNVDSKRMNEDGYKFYLSDNGVWLVDFVPYEYLDIIK